MFVARRNPALAGKEARIAGAIHPEILPDLIGAQFTDNTEVREQYRRQIERGSMPTGWYLSAASANVRRQCPREATD
jgi:hypothetical protein